ncbi:hypothetical protein H632_c5428p0, partial [Helicosporidium sp. ATCC 50920]
GRGHGAQGGHAGHAQAAGEKGCLCGLWSRRGPAWVVDLCRRRRGYTGD